MVGPVGGRKRRTAPVPPRSGPERSALQQVFSATLADTTPEYQRQILLIVEWDHGGRPATRSFEQRFLGAPPDGPGDPAPQQRRFARVVPGTVRTGR